MVVAFLFLLAGVSVVSAGDHLEVGSTSGWGIVPVIIMGNPMTCTDMGCTEGSFFRIESTTGYSANFNLGSGKTITITTSDNKTIAWTSNVDINCVFNVNGPAC